MKGKDMLKRQIRLYFAMLILLLLFALGCKHVPPFPVLSAEPWPEADTLFHKDPRWLGADDAYSIDLGHGKVLWLFGDSLIAPPEGGGRRESTMTRNSVAMQTGYDPTTADMKFFWKSRDEKPVSYFLTENENENWFWPGHGIRLPGRILVFLMRIRPDQTTWFQCEGWQVAVIENPNQPVDQWKITMPPCPQNKFGIIVGSASILCRGEYLYAYSAESTQGNPAYVVRWPLIDVMMGNFQRLEWWTGGEAGAWVPDADLTVKPSPLFTDGQTEFSVHYDLEQQIYIQTQTRSFWDPSIAVRYAEELTGPWSEPVNLYTPPQMEPGLFVYAGKAHPEMRGVDLALTYVVNTIDENRLYSDNTLYYPRFVKVMWNRQPQQ